MTMKLITSPYIQCMYVKILLTAGWTLSIYLHPSNVIREWLNYFSLLLYRETSTSLKFLIRLGQKTKISRFLFKILHVSNFHMHIHEFIKHGLVSESKKLFFFFFFVIFMWAFIDALKCANFNIFFSSFAFVKCKFLYFSQVQQRFFFNTTRLAILMH